MSRISTFARCVIVIVTLISTASTARSQVIGISEAVIAAGAAEGIKYLGGKLVSSVLDKARQVASDLLAKGGETGNGLATRGADELNVLTENAARALAAEADKVFDNLNEQNRKLMLAVHLATQAASDALSRIHDIRDTTALDLRALAGLLPFTKETLVMQRVSGLSALRKDGEYRLQLLGSYVGTPSPDHSTVIKLTLNNEEVAARLNPVALHELHAFIPAAAVNKHFKERAHVTVPLKISVQQSFKQSFLFFNWTNEKSYEVPLHMSLYGDIAAIITATSTYPTYGWRELGTENRTLRTHGHHCSSNCNNHAGGPYQLIYAVPGGVRISQQVGDKHIGSATCGCQPGSGPCEFDVRDHFSISPDKSRVQCHFRARSHANTWHLNALVYEWRNTGELNQSQSIDGFFERVIEIRVPKEGSTRLFGKFITGEPFEFLAGDVDPKGRIVMTNRVVNANDVSLFFRINRPPLDS